MSMMFNHCRACGAPTKSSWNDLPYDVQITADVAAARGVKAGDVVEWPAHWGMVAWGIVSIVEIPVDSWPQFGRKR